MNELSVLVMLAVSFLELGVTLNEWLSESVFWCTVVKAQCQHPRLVCTLVSLHVGENDLSEIFKFK